MASKSRGRGVISELTHIAPIKQGMVPGKPISYADRLRTMLEVFHKREDPGFPGVIRMFRGIHTSQWALLDGDTRLMLNVIFDGDLHGYLRGLARDVSGVLGLVWSNCEGWQSPYDNPQALIDFIERYQVRNNFFYAHNPGLTVPDVEGLQSLREAYNGLSPTASVRDLQEAVYTKSVPRSLVARTHAGFDAYGKRDESRLSFRLLLERLYSCQEVERALDEQFREERFARALPAPQQPKREELVQALVLKPYVRAHCARLLFYRFATAEAAREWVRELRAEITYYGSEPAKSAPYLTVGFTYAGLEALGVDAAQLSEFPEAFVQGMSARPLGDPKPVSDEPSVVAAPVHAVVCLHSEPEERSALYRALLNAGRAARDAAGEAPSINQADCKADAENLIHLLAEHLKQAEAAAQLPAPPAGGEQIGHQDLHMPLVSEGCGAEAYGVEYFGFRDGIAQPRTPVDLGGVSAKQASFDGVLVRDGRGLLRNASFLVLRQLRQHTGEFWDELRAQAKVLPTTPRELAEEVVGRRMDGRRLERAGHEQFDPVRDRDAFDASDDRRCPLHSHVRRANPRTDVGLGHNPPLMRRSMAYARDDARGLMFMAFNADIETQFEFVQRHWTQAGNQVGQYSDERDVLVGLGDSCARFYAKAPGGAAQAGRVLTFMNSFVALEWGIYLYIPSREALSSL